MTLFDATASGYTEMVTQLIATGAAVDATDARGKTPLMTAAYRGHAEIARALIAAGADIHGCDDHGNTALIYATYYAQLTPSCRWIAIAEALVAAGADPLREGGYRGMSALQWAEELHQDRLVRLFREG